MKAFYFEINASNYAYSADFPFTYFISSFQTHCLHIFKTKANGVYGLTFYDFLNSFKFSFIIPFHVLKQDTLRQSHSVSLRRGDSHIPHFLTFTFVPDCSSKPSTIQCLT